MAVQTDACQGCEQFKPYPMIEVEPGSPPLHGLCDECVERYGMQAGQKLRLSEPGHEGETEVTFLAPTENAVWIRYSDATTDQVAWSEFEKIE